ncbi:MAG: Alpha/beta hydrolase family protein [Syntrophorhabdus sp. PtaB.Bin047]|jgi:pimeloyl-ACP methyl ester carboxylesterase|nr:MAG: Alpha/beta hydrolase family protein [Syntrophorhabdus sp. PtaB.Bin047]
MMVHPGAIQLVLMPGLDGTGMFFGPLTRALPPDVPRTVITYPDDKNFSLKDHADFVAARLTGEDTILVAESFSGLVALILLHARPASVKGVIFSAAFAEPLHPLLIRTVASIPGAASLARRLPAGLLNVLFFHSYADEALEELLRQSLQRTGPAGLRRRARLIAEGYPFPDDLFPLPCLYLQAAQDRVVPARAADWFRSRFASFELVTLDAPHCLLQTRPAESAEAIMAFARGLP